MKQLGNVVTGVLIFALGGALDYFGSSPRILYLPAFALCAWILYNVHSYVSLKEKDIDGEKNRIEAREERSDRLLEKVEENTPQSTGLLLPGTAEIPKIERGPIPQELLQTLPESLRKELQSLAGKSFPPTRKIPDSALIIFLGNSVSWTESFPHTVLKHKGENIIVLGKDGENMWVTAEFFGQNGKIICQLVKNRFHLNFANLWRIERPSPSRLVVVNDKAQEILDVEYINKRAVRILGDFYSLGGSHIVIRSDWQSLGGGKMSACISGNNGGASYAIQ